MVSIPLKNMKLSWDDYSIYYGKKVMFQTTNQILWDLCFGEIPPQFQLPSGSTASRSSRIATPSVVASEVAVATDGSRAADAWRAAQGARLGLGTWGWVFWPMNLSDLGEYQGISSINSWLVVSTPLKNMKVKWDSCSQYMEK